MLGAALDERMGVEVAEPTPEPHLLLGRQLLAPEHDDVMVEEGSVDRVERLV